MVESALDEPMPDRLARMQQGQIGLQTRMRGLTQGIGAREDRRASGFAQDGLPGELDGLRRVLPWSGEDRWRPLTKGMR